MKLSVHLVFNGQCEAAFRFYAQCLGGTISTMLTYGDSPMAAQTPAEWRDKNATWAKRFGVLVDQFGTPWEINCGRAG